MDWLNAPGSNATTVLARPGQARAGKMWRMQADGPCFHGTAALARTAPRQCLVRDAPDITMPGSAGREAAPVPARDTADAAFMMAPSQGRRRQPLP